ncbi:ribosomal protein S16 [Rhizodiscina lignyota]|uniref:Ribosomal protein S16 n=1 Tax=Rhizodiscina lignyota TaxID=1504668 RepID=A0A9P4ITD0_9PEZI|nr:ribosomal protein S16 [Rhizodiscina lignyota]
MVVRIRLARFGKRNNPFYNIVVAQSKSGRNKKPMEVLGTFDPIPKESPPGERGEPGEKARLVKDIRLDTARTKYWLGVGAQPSEPVWKLLSILGLVERSFREDQLRKQAHEADERHRAYWAAKAAESGSLSTDSTATITKAAPLDPQ